MKKIVIEVGDEGIAVIPEGFTDKTELFAALVMSVVKIRGEVFKEVLDRKEEIIEEMEKTGICTCPACETKRRLELH